MNERVKLSLLSLLLTSCATAPVPKATVSVDVPAPTPSVQQVVVREDPSLVSTTALDVPETLQIDGDLREWGSLEPRPVKPSEKRETDEKQALLHASSHIAVALDAEQFAIAAELRGDAKDGVWLSVRFPWDGVLAVGRVQADGALQPFDCDPLTVPAEIAECRRYVKAHADLETAYRARSIRTFRVDRSGIQERVGEGRLVPIKVAGSSGKTLSVRASADVVRVEALLPITMLPDVRGLTVDSVGLAARPIANEPKFPDELYAWSDLSIDLAFGRDADLRARVLDMFNVPMVATYSPGGDVLRRLTYVLDGTADDMTHLQEHVETLYRAQKKFGDVEVGYMLDDLGIAIYRAGQLSDVRQFPSPNGMVEREGELHVFGFVSSPVGDGTTYAAYNVLGIAKDGLIRDGLLLPVENISNRFARVEEFHADDFSTFGIRGTDKADLDKGSHNVTTVTWRYDVKEKAYFPTEHYGPAPRQKKPKRRD